MTQQENRQGMHNRLNLHIWAGPVLIPAHNMGMGDVSAVGTESCGPI